MSKTTGWVPAVVLLALPMVMLALPEESAAAAKVKFKPYKFETNDGEEVQAELGKLRVKESREREDSRKITLQFVRFRSTSPSPGSPIVYLAGGPGGSGIRTARGSRFPLFMALREFGDVIAFDQRGTGLTGFEELDCDDRYQIPPDEPIDRAKAGAIIAEVTRGCAVRLRRSGIDLSAYNTRESAADLEDLRVALGADKLTLWGISYGTHLALAMMKYHPESVDRAILAGLEGLHHSHKLPSDQQALLEEIARLAKKDAAVNASLPDLLGSIERILAMLEEPKTVPLTHPTEGMTVNVKVGQFDLQYALANMLSGPASFAAMPDAIARVERGDFLPLALASGQSRSGEGLHGMLVAMDCSSGAGKEWTDRIAREAPGTLLGDAINFPFPEVCQGLGIDDLGEAFRAPVKSDVPTLLISGTLDGRTPPRNAEELMPFLPNAQHLVIVGAGHSDPLFLSSPQILKSMQAFLRKEKIPVKRIELPPVRFIAPRRTVTLDEDVLAKYVGSYRIEKDDVRRVMKAGDLLWTRRGRGGPLPIRPTSETEFFYEGGTTHLRFETDATGNVTGMMVFHGGSSEGEPATRVP